MAKQQRTTLYHPDGRKYETSDRVEVTRLKAHGYTTKPPKRAEAPKPSTSQPDTK